MKVTRSLFNQMSAPDILSNQINDFEILGWCYLKRRYIIAQNRVNGDLYRILPVTIISVTHNKTGVILTVKRSDRNEHFRFPGIAEAVAWESRIRRIMAESLEKGQIYI